MTSEPHILVNDPAPDWMPVSKAQRERQETTMAQTVQPRPQVKRETRVDRLDAFLRDNAAKCKLEGWNQLVETLQLPPAMYAALATGRPEMIKLVEPRDLPAEDVAKLFKIIAVLIETNRALQIHAEQVADSVDIWGQAFKQLSSLGRQIEHFANFRAINAEPEEE